jgi:predicted acylesterase/phospholipase RssA
MSDVPRTTNPQISIDYIGPVLYKDLIAANRNRSIDPHSTQILDHEKTYIENWRRTANVGRSTDGVKETLSGLALSGGGIRSATFALGVTQAFAAQDLMRRFDYLSTVSGGGYLGSSLTWLTRNSNAQDAGCRFTFGMDSDHFPYPIDPPDRQTDRRADPAQDAQLIYLRQHGKYLTPGRGIDIVSAIAVVLRGVLLNLLVWLPLAALVLFLLLLVPSVDVVPPFVALQDRFPKNGYGWMAIVSAVAVLAFAGLAVIYSLMTYATGVEHPWRYRCRRLVETNIRYVLWTIVATLPVALMPMTSRGAQDWLSSLGVASIVAGVASAVGTFLRSRSGSNKAGLTMSIIAPLGAVLLLYGLLILGYVWAERFTWHAFSYAHSQSTSSAGWLLWASPVLLVIAGVTGFFVNVNLISVHRYYRDRLMEAFLSDPPAVSKNGEIAYTDVAEAADIGKLHKFAETDTPTGPYHLVNTNVILVDSKKKNWRVRGGDSFVLSPLLCGSNATGWCSTKNFLDGDLTLATATAISGAAANPYAGGGLFRNRPVALLMSLVNLRLGYWVGHPGPEKQKSKRRTHFSTAWRELSGKLSEDRPMLQLSDGGHFDNLGIYELIRRRARLIVACDGTADPEFGFSDFIALLARIEADFGARIAFNPGAGLEVFMPSTAAGFPRNTQLAQRGFTVGKIRYSDNSEGDLIYVTTTLFSGLGLAILGYKAVHPDFPDQTTADQFFDEAQFEAYRHLGYSVGEAVLGDDECRKILHQHLGLDLPPAANPGVTVQGAMRRYY